MHFKNNSADRYKRLPSFLGDFFYDFNNEELNRKNYFKSVPSVNISESAEQFTVELAVPGLDKNDFRIAIENRSMTISADKKTETADENTKFTKKEFSYTNFSRTFTLPEQVQSDNITAEYVNGILKLSLPKKEEAKQKPSREVKIS